jgi:hypothetical protein
VVVVVDRLGAGWLGPYGNTWIPTPSLNQLAAQSLLCEFVVGDSYSLVDAYHSYWSGLPAFCSATPSWSSLPQLAAQAGLQPVLITDAEEITQHPLVEGFEEGKLLRVKPPQRLVASVEQTRLAQLFHMAGEAITRGDQPSFVWIHAQGPNAAWDAPYPLREQLADEDDPPPLQFAAPVHQALAKGYDPDELLGIVQSYAAEVVSFDESLGALLKTIDATLDPRETLLVLTSPRGYALGEHLAIGSAGDSLRGEVLQVPLLVRFPEQAHRLTRLISLHQPVDLFATIAAALQTDAPTGWGSDLARVARGELAASPLAIASSGKEIALRSPAWLFRKAITDEAAKVELYAKPDDRWEVNEISARAPDVVEQFEACWSAIEPQLSRQSPPTVELPESLMDSLAR